MLALDVSLQASFLGKLLWAFLTEKLFFFSVSPGDVSLQISGNLKSFFANVANEGSVVLVNFLLVKF